MSAERWYKLSLPEQMANIGSEVQRAFIWQERGDNEQKEKSIDRFLELIDSSLSDKRWQKRCLEICRIREVLCDYFFANNSFGNLFESIINYFNEFALVKKT